MKGGASVKALHDVNLSIKEGELIVIRGPSGSGKSTLLNMIGALDLPTKGEVKIGGERTDKMTTKELAHVRQHIGFVFQYYNLIPRLTAFQNVELPIIIQKRITKEERYKKVMELLRLVGLGTRRDHTPLQLSGGQQQRVAIARALAQSPHFLLMDEPTGNVDTKARDQLMALTRKVNRIKKITTIIVTHDPEIALMADRVISILDGAVIGVETQEGIELGADSLEITDENLNTIAGEGD
jgi:putative ABC transport system ATP-binding protein